MNFHRRCWISGKLFAEDVIIAVSFMAERTGLAYYLSLQTKTIACHHNRGSVFVSWVVSW